MSYEKGFKAFSLDMDLEDIAKICDGNMQGNPNVTNIGLTFMTVKSTMNLIDSNDKIAKETAATLSTFMMESASLIAETTRSFKETSDKSSKSLNRATWVLAVATIINFIAMIWITYCNTPAK